MRSFFALNLNDGEGERTVQMALDPNAFSDSRYGFVNAADQMVLEAQSGGELVTFEVTYEKFNTDPDIADIIYISIPLTQQSAALTRRGEGDNCIPTFRLIE